VSREVSGVERVPDANHEYQHCQRGVSRRGPVPATGCRLEGRHGILRARTRVHGSQDAEHPAQLVNGLAAGPLNRGQRRTCTLGFARQDLFGARRLQHHLADGVRDRIVGLVRHALALARHCDTLADRPLLFQP
jgi:hypothetical protein